VVTLFLWRWERKSRRNFRSGGFRFEVRRRLLLHEEEILLQLLQLAAEFADICFRVNEVGAPLRAGRQFVDGGKDRAEAIDTQPAIERVPGAFENGFAPFLRSEFFREGLRRVAGGGRVCSMLLVVTEIVMARSVPVI
jgi:hypothetical protein